MQELQIWNPQGHVQQNGWGLPQQVHTNVRFLALEFRFAVMAGTPLPRQRV